MSRRAVFLDREGLINVKPPAGEYVRRWAEFRLIPAAVDWMCLFNAIELPVIVVTKQRGVAYGRVAAGAVEKIHHNMVSLLARGGTRVDQVLCCPRDAGTCDCRKPGPGLVLRARDTWGIDLSRLIDSGHAAESVPAS